MGDLRSIRVFVLGEAEKPGSYTVSGLSTMTNALFVSGGVKKIGSLRNIQLKRNGQLITTLDLYDLLLHGDTSGDRQLLPGDVIFIPPDRPHRIRLRCGTETGDLRVEEGEDSRAGNRSSRAAYPLTPIRSAVSCKEFCPRNCEKCENIDLSAAAGRLTPLDNGDKLRIPEIRPTLENSVTLAG